MVAGSGTVGENAVDLARRLMADIGGLPGLVRADATSLMRVKGLGPAKTAQLLAAIELGRRIHRIDPSDRSLLTTPEAVFAYMSGRLRDKPKEELHVLSLDTRGRLLGAAMVISDGVNSVGARPAEVFREPTVLHAAPRSSSSTTTRLATLTRAPRTLRSHALSKLRVKCSRSPSWTT